MHYTKAIQYHRFPHYRGRGRWGGYFVSGVGQDLMHYDLGPEDETAAGSWERGLKASYRHYGRPNDVGVGMGSISGFPLNPLSMIGETVQAVAHVADSMPAPFKHRQHRQRRIIQDYDDE